MFYYLDQIGGFILVVLFGLVHPSSLMVYMLWYFIFFCEWGILQIRRTKYSVYSVGEVSITGSETTTQWLSMLAPSTSADLSKDWNVVTRNTRVILLWAIN